MAQLHDIYDDDDDDDDVLYFNFRNCMGSFDLMCRETCEPVCGMYGEKRRAYWVLLGKHKGKSLLGRPRGTSPPNATTCSYELSWFPSWLWR